MADALSDILGTPVADPEEEAFLAFTQNIPSLSLGFVDSHATELAVAVAGRSFVVKQSRSLLTSNRKAGTTGAVLWKVTPLVAEWLSSDSPPNFLFRSGLLGQASTVLELGAGTSGVIALALAPRVKRYVATDQDYALKLLRQNIADNLPTNDNASAKGRPRKGKHVALDLHEPRIDTLELDWEVDAASSLPDLLDDDSSAAASGGTDAEKSIGLVIASDCIYNDALIEPLNSTCAQICRLRRDAQSPCSNGRTTICLVAQQLRSHDVFESWLVSFHRLFHVWKVPDHLLIEGLREHTGFIVHVGIVR